MGAKKKSGTATKITHEAIQTACLIDLRLRTDEIYSFALLAFWARVTSEAESGEIGRDCLD